MNNNYYNPYGYYQQPQYQPQQQQVVIPMTYVNGLEGAKAYWMGVNSIAYLRDNNDDSIMYEKRTDAVGKYQLLAYKLTKLETVNNSSFKLPDNDDHIKRLETKIDDIYNILVPKQEVKPNE